MLKVVPSGLLTVICTLWLSHPPLDCHVHVNAAHTSAYACNSYRRMNCTLPPWHCNPHVLCCSVWLWPKGRENSCCLDSLRAKEPGRALLHALPVREPIGTALQELNSTVVSKRRVPAPSHHTLPHTFPYQARTITTFIAFLGLTQQRPSNTCKLTINLINRIDAELESTLTQPFPDCAIFWDSVNSTCWLLPENVLCKTIDLTPLVCSPLGRACVHLELQPPMTTRLPLVTQPISSQICRLFLSSGGSS